VDTDRFRPRNSLTQRETPHPMTVGSDRAHQVFLVVLLAAIGVSLCSCDKAPEARESENDLYVGLTRGSVRIHRLLDGHAPDCRLLFQAVRTVGSLRSSFWQYDMRSGRVESLGVPPDTIWVGYVGSLPSLVAVHARTSNGRAIVTVFGEELRPAGQALCQLPRGFPGLPQLSPSRERLACAIRDLRKGAVDLFVLDASGHCRRLTNTGDVHPDAWSWDGGGEYLVFRRRDGRSGSSVLEGLWSVSVHQPEIRKVLEKKGFGIPFRGPETGQILVLGPDFTLATSRTDGYHRQLLLLDILRGTATEVIHESEPIGEPSLSPSRTFMAYLAGDAVVVIALGERQRRRCIRLPAAVLVCDDKGEHVAETRCEWLDDRRLAVVAKHGRSLWVVDTEAGNWARIIPPRDWGNGVPNKFLLRKAGFWGNDAGAGGPAGLPGAVP